MLTCVCTFVGLALLSLGHRSARYLHAQPDSIKSMFTNDKRERELQKGEKFALRGAAPTHC